ncbi:MAG: PEP-CTERM sorting domain-containing protein [Verrucomicrobiota bacterium]
MIRTLPTAFIVLAMPIAASRMSAASLTPLGGLPGGGLQSLATDLSADGQVVVGGAASSGGGRAFRWTRAGGMKDLGVLDRGSFGSIAVGVSADGEVVMGNSSSARTRTGVEPFRWTASRGMERLSGDLPTGLDGAEVRSISADASVVVGIGWKSSTPNVTPRRPLPIRWTADRGWQLLGGFTSTASEGAAVAVSGDGGTTVGTVSVPRRGDAVIWTLDAPMRALGIPAENTYEGARPWAASFNGRIIVGSVNVAGQQYACRWTEREGLTFLKEFPSLYQYSAATGISDDGTVIVGGDAGLGSFVWEPETGMVSLWKRLVNLGVNPASQAWLTLDGPQSISGNGRFMCGSGFRGKSDQAYLVDLAPELKFQRVAGGLRLTWPDGYRLQRSPSLESESWETVPDAMSPQVVPLDSQIYCFRLAAPR